MGCICGCHDKLKTVGVLGCCFECEKDHDQLRNARARIANAIDRIDTSGGTDGAHHKQWVLDQTLRELMSAEEYGAFLVARAKDGYDWETGVAP